MILYAGRVVHRREGAVAHAFAHRVFALLLDLDAVPEASRRLRLFGHNRAALFAFYDRDHGPRDGAPLRPWVEAHLDSVGVPAGGRIRILCFPRMLGYVFNPLSLYWCDGSDGRLAAMVYEVRNTFGESHAYVLKVDPQDGAGTIRQTCAKAFHVSPFLGMAARYHFTLRPPGDRFALAVRETGPDGRPILTVGWAGRARPMTDAVLARAFLAYPAMTIGVSAAIRWQALRLWWKGAPWHRHPGRRDDRPAPPAGAEGA